MKRFFLFLFVATMMVACSNDDDSNNDSNGNDIFISFKANGTEYNIEPYSASSMKIDFGGDQGMGEDFRSISLSMPLDFTEGEHNIVDSFETEDYNANYSEGDVTIDASSGTLDVTNISDEYIEGSFTFTGQDDEGNTYSITQGSFKVYNL